MGRRRPFWAVPSKEELQAQAQRLGIADRITWLGAKPQDAVLEEYRGADLFSLNSRIAEGGDRDGLPNVLMEAQSQRLPVIATNIAGIPELVIDGETGALVPAEKEASAEKDGDHLGFFRDGEPISWEEATLGPEGAAALRAVASIPEANREDFFDELYDRYPDDCGHPIYAENDDLTVVRTLIEAIGVDRARALGENMPRLTFKAVGRAALPDCEWCKGSGLKECEVGGVGSKVKMQCDCTKRRRWEDFKGLKALLEREKAEHDAKQGIPQQDFSFGLEVTTKDGRVWASGVRL